MASSKIVLYDIPAKSGKWCWSPNVWKTRALLNCKGLTYDTEWVDFPEIKPTLQSYNLEPAPNGMPGIEYTLPTIKLPDGKFVMESSKIAAEIERLHPSPPMYLELGLHEQAQSLLQKIAFPLFPQLMPVVRDTLLTDHGKPHWVGHCEQAFGPIDEVYRTKGGAAAWEAAKPGLDELVEFLRTNKTDNGPFVLGSRMSYADLVLVAFLKSAHVIGHGLFEGIMRGDKTLQEFWEACQECLQKDQ